MKKKNKNENIIVKFNLNGLETGIKCKRSEYIENIIEQYIKEIQKDLNNIYFLYRGDMLNKKLKIEEINKQETEIKILVYELEGIDEIEEKLKESEGIICPGCKEICFFNIKNYKINLNGCKKNHFFSNIIISDFNDLQKIDESKILCHKCKENKLNTSGNKFYICIDCNTNYCPLCKLSHNKNHKIIDYDMKDYYCHNHEERFISYCNRCNENLCDLCDNINHNITYLYKLKNKDKSIFKLKEKIDDLKSEKPDEEKKLIKIIENLELYYNIVNNIINRYNNKKYKNFQILMNINNLNNYNHKVIEDIDKIKNENIKLETISNLYKNMVIDNEIILK
jgi:hypothetical protein